MGVVAKFAKTEDSFFRIRSPIAQLWGKKAGKNGPVSRKLQPTFPKSDRLLCCAWEIGLRIAVKNFLQHFVRVAHGLPATENFFVGENRKIAPYHHAVL